MSEYTNDNEGNVLHLTLNKFDDEKNEDINGDISMNLKDNKNGSKKKNKKSLKKEKIKEKKYIKKNEKLTNKIVKLIKITKEKELFHKNQADMMSEKAKNLENLLNFAPGMDFIQLKKQLIKIIKDSKKECKNSKKKLKKEKITEKKKNNLIKKNEKMIKKKLKLKIMENNRINDISLLNISKNDFLEIYIDGYNIVGCDKLCSKYMRGKVSLARQRLLELVYPFYNERNLNIGYQLIVNVWFDKNGKDIKYNNVINVHFSGKQSVDDKLVEMFGKTDKVSNKLVITSDKELTVRLAKVGVKCMKSGVFYKKYLENEKKINKKDESVINMVIDGQQFVEDPEIETRLANDLEPNNNNNDSTSDCDDDDNEQDNNDGEDDLIEMELEGMDSYPDEVGAYPSPK